MLAQVAGEFAIVLWDAVNRTLFAARDRFGIKPLFYAFYDNTLFLASEIKALFAAGVPARWDCESVYDVGELAVPKCGLYTRGFSNSTRAVHDRNGKADRFA